MSKELKALKELRLQVGSIHYYDMTGGTPKETTLLLRDSELFKTIETALDDYENLKLKHRSIQDAVLDDFNKLKALEIIKEYKVNVSVIIYCIENDICYAEYVRKELWDDAQESEPAYPMEESEFNILKEALK